MAIIEGHARELTDAETAARAEECKAIEDHILDALQRGREAMWDLAHWCWEFNQRSGWTALACETQNEWLAQPSVTIRASEFHWLVRQWRVCVIERQIPMELLASIPKAKLRIVMPAIESRERETPLEEILVNARELGARDLIEEYKPPEGGEAAAETPPPSPEPVQQAKENEVAIDPEVLEAASVVETYLELSGDRRKAARAWRRFYEEHPVFLAAAAIERYFDQADDAPSQQQAHAHWRTLTERVGIEIVYED